MTHKWQTPFLPAVLWKVEWLHFISYQHFCKYEISSTPYGWASISIKQSPIELQIPHNIHRAHTASQWHDWEDMAVLPAKAAPIAGTSWQILHSFQDDKFLLEEAWEDASAGAARATYKMTEVAGREKEAAQHVCFRTSERKHNEVASKERLFRLPKHTRDCWSSLTAFSYPRNALGKF